MLLASEDHIHWERIKICATSVRPASSSKTDSANSAPTMAASASMNSHAPLACQDSSSSTGSVNSVMLGARCAQVTGVARFVSPDGYSTGKIIVSSVVKASILKVASAKLVSKSTALSVQIPKLVRVVKMISC